MKRHRKGNGIVLVALLCMSCFLLTACGGQGDQPSGEYLPEKYGLESDTITIVWWEDQVGYNTIQITDAEEIQTLREAVDFAAWVPIEEEPIGLDYYFLQFNEGTTIAVGMDGAVGTVGESSSENIENLKGNESYYDLPEGFYQTVMNLVENK